MVTEPAPNCSAFSGDFTDCEGKEDPRRREALLSDGCEGWEPNDPLNKALPPDGAPPVPAEAGWDAEDPPNEKPPPDGAPPVPAEAGWDAEDPPNEKPPPDEKVAASVFESPTDADSESKVEGYGLGETKAITFIAMGRRASRPSLRGDGASSRLVGSTHRREIRPQSRFKSR